MLPKRFVVVGVLRSTETSLQEIFAQVETNIIQTHHEVDHGVLSRLLQMVQPLTMSCTEASEYQSLVKMLDGLDRAYNTPFQRLFYLAIPPAVFPTVIECLTAAGLQNDSGGIARRILVEKPFGTDLASAKELVRVMATSFKETQIYRIDHYLAKENVQNILTFRFNNPLIEDMWGRQFIDHIQISAVEKIGIDSRSNFYESMGALRDIVQSHLMQLMALVMMEAPVIKDSDSIHREKFALLQAITPLKPNHVEELTVRGQYQGYREEVNNPNSTTETYAALCLEVANSRWGGVPILLRTGKSLTRQETTIKLIFKDRSRRSLPPNLLTIRIQPNEGISIRLAAKRPGFEDNLQPVDMDFTYQNSFSEDSPDAYERVLMDCIIGDQSLFASHEEVMRCWEILQPVLDYWHSSKDAPTVYVPGTWGPTAADDLAANFGSEWL
jgi:glucose-6-phosphate 1-dehydrogenase